MGALRLQTPDERRDRGLSEELLIRCSLRFCLVPDWYFRTLDRYLVSMPFHHFSRNLFLSFLLTNVAQARTEHDASYRAFAETELDLRDYESGVGPVLHGGFVLGLVENIYEQADLLLVLEAFELEHRLQIGEKGSDAVSHR